MATALLYEEPGIATILVLSSFLLLLNIMNYVLNYLIYCGLLGQIFDGVVWSQASLLGDTSESLMVQIGYLSLVLLAYEGKPGLHVPSHCSSTDFCNRRTLNIVLFRQS